MVKWSELDQRDRDKLVAEHIFGFTARVYRDVLGDTLHVVDDTAQRDDVGGTSTQLLGGSWDRGYDENGVLREFFGCICPAFSANLEEAARVEREIERRGLGVRYVHNLYHVVIDPMVAQEGADSVFRLLRAEPHQRCYAALRAVDVELAL